MGNAETKCFWKNRGKQRFKAKNEKMEIKIFIKKIVKCNFKKVKEFYH